MDVPDYLKTGWIPEKTTQETIEKLKQRIEELESQIRKLSRELARMSQREYNG